MGRDNQPKERQRKDLARKRSNRSPHPRILIVCEDRKSAPNYFREIRSHYRIQTASVQVLPSEGTDPRSVVEYARKLFDSGDTHKQIIRRSFDCVYAVFDRDDHLSYHAALALAKSLDDRLRNDQKQKVRFVAMPSVPCFELWLLLHYEDIQAPLHRDEVQKRLRRHLPDYDKGGKGYFERIRHNQPQAIIRAQNLARQTTPDSGTAPYTAIAELVTALCQLTSPSK